MSTLRHDWSRSEVEDLLALPLPDLLYRAATAHRLLEDAIGYAASGIPVTASQASATAGKFSELRDQPGFAETFLVDGQPP